MQCEWSKWSYSGSDTSTTNNTHKEKKVENHNSCSNSCSDSFTNSRSGKHNRRRCNCRTNSHRDSVARCAWTETRAIGFVLDADGLLDVGIHARRNAWNVRCWSL